jgi:chromosome segregation ATPase
MSTSLAEYLSALEARDAREQAHRVYLEAYTKLANSTAGASGPRVGAVADAPADTPAEADSGTTVTQLRTQLAATHQTRSTLEAELSTVRASLATLQATDVQQKQRIVQLEKARANLERRGKDRADELKGKGRFVEEVQDEMVALNLQLNMAEQEKERLRKENEELTRRWVKKMEDEAARMNAQMGWEQ